MLFFLQPKSPQESGSNVGTPSHAAPGGYVGFLWDMIGVKEWLLVPILALDAHTANERASHWGGGGGILVCETQEGMWHVGRECLRTSLIEVISRVHYGELI